LVAERRLAHFKVGRKVRISRAELAAWLDRNRVERAS
jgi:excisionase family DNA binding protein